MIFVNRSGNCSLNYLQIRASQVHHSEADRDPCHSSTATQACRIGVGNRAKSGYRGRGGLPSNCGLIGGHARQSSSGPAETGTRQFSTGMPLTQQRFRALVHAPKERTCQTTDSAKPRWLTPRNAPKCASPSQCIARPGFRSSSVRRRGLGGWALPLGTTKGGCGTGGCCGM